MTYWQMQADLGPGMFLFGTQAGSRESARKKVAEVIGDRTALTEITEIPEPRLRGPARRWKRSDITDEHALDLARRWQDDHFGQPGVIGALMAEGVPEKVALAKVEHMAERGLLDYGTSPYHAWPA